MMSKRNLLIGRGEKLITSGQWKQSGGAKPLPYTIDQQRNSFLGPLEEIIQLSMKAVPQLTPRGEITAKFTLQPEFLAKSYFPTQLIKKSGLRLLGSRPRVVKPRQMVRGKEPQASATAELILAGTRSSFELVREALNSNDATFSSRQNEICRLESIASFGPADRNRTRMQSFNGWCEVVLHASREDSDVIAAFSAVTSSAEILLPKHRIRSIGSLTFAPLRIDLDKAEDSIALLSQFTHLRVIRNMPDLSGELDTTAQNEIWREFEQMVSVPQKPAIDQKQRVAIFDGGTNADELERWVNHLDCDGVPTATPGLLNHGHHVTSSFLFGPLSADTTELPTPFARVDHWRVLPHESGSANVIDVIDRIENVLKRARDLGKPYELANLSLGPRMPIIDDDVHEWTVRLDDFLSEGDLFMTVAVGNDGHHGSELGRIQPPADAVNAFAVGSSDRSGKKWNRSVYSCVGPGRSPGLVKPDAVMHGGSPSEPLVLYTPVLGTLSAKQGTSYSAPLALRLASGIKASIDEPVTTNTLHALLVSASSFSARMHEQNSVGWGKLPGNVSDVLYSRSDEVAVMYQGFVEEGHPLRVAIPIPSEVPEDQFVSITATFVYRAVTDPAHPVNYTRSGLRVRFQPDSENSAPFFGSGMYDTEQVLRSDALRWDTCLHKAKRKRARDLTNPSFVVDYQTREEGAPRRNKDPKNPMSLPFALVVRVRIPHMDDISERILAEFDVLEEVVLNADIEIGIEP